MASPRRFGNLPRTLEVRTKDGHKTVHDHLSGRELSGQPYIPSGYELVDRYEHATHGRVSIYQEHAQ